jgi:hypothetical protein
MLPMRGMRRHRKVLHRRADSWSQMREISVSGHSGRGEKEVQSVIEVWKFPVLVPEKVGIPLSCPQWRFPSYWTWWETCWWDGEDAAAV